MASKNPFSTEAARREDSSRIALNKAYREAVEAAENSSAAAEQSENQNQGMSGSSGQQQTTGTSTGMKQSTLNQISPEEKRQQFSYKRELSKNYAQEEQLMRNIVKKSTESETAVCPAYLDQSTGKGVMAAYVEPVKERSAQMVDEMQQYGAVKRPVVTRVKGYVPQMVDEVQFNGAMRGSAPITQQELDDKQFHTKKPYVENRPYRVDEEQRFGPIYDLEADPEEMSYEEAARSVQADMDEAARLQEVNAAYLAYLKKENAEAWDTLYGPSRTMDPEVRALNNAYIHYLQNMIGWVWWM